MNSAHYFFYLSYVIFVFFNYPIVFQFVFNHSSMLLY